MHNPTVLLSPAPYLIAFSILYIRVVACQISIKPVDFEGLIKKPCYDTASPAVPRANTIDNFIALVSKIEAANSRLAQDADQLIKTLLSRFRMDNYYYDVRARAPVDETNPRTNNIIAALFQPSFQQDQSFLSGAFPEHYLTPEEKCSMYFMLSHYLLPATFTPSPYQSSMASSPLSPVVQLSLPQSGIRPPSLQAAGLATYPAASADNTYTAGAGGSRYSGPSPSYGSPMTRNMASFGQGVNTQPDYTGNNPYGTNVPQPSNQLNINYNNLRQTGQYAGTIMSNTRYNSPLVVGQARQDGSQGGSGNNNKAAIEYGVVAVGSQEDAAVVLNRVLLGILAANMPGQSVRQLASSVFPTSHLALSQSMMDNEIDPLFAVTLADLWAVSAKTKPGKPVDVRGDDGHWNDTMCPTTFRLDQASSKRFTKAELLGGLDGFNLGMLRRRLVGVGRGGIRLSEMLRMYYSRNGFKPQLPDVGVCYRGSQLSSQLDQLERQAQNYLRLYELSVPMTDKDVEMSIRRLDTFRDAARQAANQVPQEICSESDMMGEPSATGGGGQLGEQCEIARADLVTVLDTSSEADQAFMRMVVAKLAQKLGLSRDGSSMTVLTNQQGSPGAGLNGKISNSTNTAEVGCALVYDATDTYSGSPVTDPSALMGMFEQALINLDDEYRVKQGYGLVAMYSGTSRPAGASYASASYTPAASSSSAYGQGASSYSMQRQASYSSVEGTGGSKVIVFFNYGGPLRANRIASGATNWQGSSNSMEQYTNKFQDAKKFLRENFRSSAILAVAPNGEDVKDMVFDPDRDIFTDVPTSISAPAYETVGYWADPRLRDSAEQLAQQLVRRMCSVPAVFQYPLCFRYPSDATKAVGYISPGRKQYWMMSPKTFFASKYVRLAFRVEGGRLRVCFGRKPNPDETALRSGQTQYQQTNAIAFNPSSANGGVGQPVQQQQQQQQPSSSDYYTGMEYGVCKDVAPQQEIDFLVSDPCYRTAIADCQPFYFVIKEISNLGESDPNYMCREPGCRRIDQAKFTLSHSGISCSSAFKMVVANWYLIILSIIFTTFGLQGQLSPSSINLYGRKFASGFKQATLKATSISAMSVVALFSTLCNVQSAQAQQAGVYDFGQNRYGEKRGNLTPSEVAAIILLVMTILLALALTAGLCYYVTKRSKRDGMQQVPRDGF